jgi:probable O-glycosylation ligase (exosortase A-associated)
VLNLALAGFVLMILALGLRRPFLWVLLYLYIDVLAPQKFPLALLASIPVSLIAFVLAVVGWAFFDDKRNLRFSFRQFLLVALLVYCGITTQTADFPEAAAAKWDWVWKALVFAIFMPLTLTTRLRLEAASLVMVLSAAAIIIEGAIKTLAGGGGYNMLKFFINDNTGLYEGSTLACVAIALIPLALWLSREGTIFPPDWRTRWFAYGLAFAAVLIPVGTEARTGLVCAGLLAVMMLRTVKNRGIYIAMMALAGFVALPLLPSTFSKRMNTIENNKADESASTRIAVWTWTLGYVGDHPFGGGFDAFRGNKLVIHTQDAASDGGGVTTVKNGETTDAGRAYHSAYFEMLGEQGWPGLILWLTIQISGIVQLEGVQRRLRKSADPRDKKDAAMAVALQQGHVVYMLGAAFVGIAFQPFIYMLIGLQIALVRQVGERRRAGADIARRPGVRMQGAARFSRRA